jgi:hypothetical protein
MRYLKRFNESVDDTINDITEICYELTDGRFAVKVYDNFPGWGNISGVGVPVHPDEWKLSNENKIVVISLSDYRDYDGFSFDEVREVVLRLIDYLGDRYKGCSVLSVGEHERYNINKSEIVSHYWIGNLTNLIIIYK